MINDSQGANILPLEQRLRVTHKGRCCACKAWDTGEYMSDLAQISPTKTITNIFQMQLSARPNQAISVYGSPRYTSSSSLSNA